MAGARVRRATDADRPAWDALVSARPEGDLLQSWAWGECQRLAGEAPLRLVAQGSDGSLRGVAQALLRPIGLGRSVAYVPHGPVWEREAADATQLLGAILDGLREEAGAARAIVVKVDPRAELGEAHQIGEQLRRYGLVRSDDLQAPTTRIVDLLDGADQLRATWDKNARNLARRAEREGVRVTVDRGVDEAHLSTLHQLLTVTGERGDFRVRSPEFLACLAGEMAQRDGWYLALAWSDDAPIAAMVTPRLGDRAYYLYGASLRDERYKHKNGAYAVMSTLQSTLAGDGVRTLDLWGVVEPGDESADPTWSGFSAFKRKFGGTPLRHPGLHDLIVDRLWYRLREARASIRGALSRR
jgi:lipid II:glycine glycyltransferase (peptidoglycan interpeptide bridge formation enzyme)